MSASGNRPLSPYRNRNPVMISSSTSSAPCWRGTVLQRLEERVLRRHDAHVPRHRLDDDRRGLVAVRLEPLRECVRVVVGKHGGPGGDGFRHARRVAQPERCHPASRFHQEPVAVAVVAPLELHDEVAPGGRPRQADGRHRRFRPRVHEPQPFEPSRLADAPPQLHLPRRERPEGRPSRGRLPQRRHHRRVRVPEDERPVRRDIIDVLRALRVV